VYIPAASLHVQDGGFDLKHVAQFISFIKKPYVLWIYADEGMYAVGLGTR
jgi:hypothetical protein